ncbi:DUF2726 domain-containing protein [Paraburkholderia acidipaludis]|uniref:DUF2726 domain-containing protein n=1 Tax=Paraburkholderia acidipaludis TaxID=660537 RepID=UPI0004806718|nr:DUF2726 domain-containing protein [Paraburkholderia acidipaludis]
MSTSFETMREQLESCDVSGFLAAYVEYRIKQPSDPKMLSLTQKILPAVLRREFAANTLEATTVVQLWHMVRGGSLIFIDNDLLEAINLRIDAALRTVDPAAVLPAPRLPIFDESNRLRTPAKPENEADVVAKQGNHDSIVEMKRVAIVSQFTLGIWSMADAFDFRKNLCASNQEWEFLQAVRQYFPSMRAYPNLPLRNFIDIDKLEVRLPFRVRNYAWAAQVDVLLCTEDEDPVAGIELDSVHHDSDEAAERDQLKNQLFQLAGLPLVRIRASDAKSVRAEDFYDLLQSEADELDKLRPRRLRPRRNHESLVPAEAYAANSSAQPY